MPLSRRLRVTLLAACVLLPTFLTAGPASAATVPLNGRTFNDACNAATAGDTVLVPAGSYGGQSISCQKSVTLLAQGSVTLASLSFSNANGPTADGFKVTGSSDNGAASVMKSKNITIRNTTFNNMVYLEGAVDTLFDHDTWEPLNSSTAWSNGDMMDLYEQTRTPTPNTRVTVQDSVFHGLRAPNSAAHSDAIQICNCASSDAQHTIDFKVLRTKFYDNECMNIRTNPQDEVTLENNLFGDTMRGISGCGDFSLDVLAANANVRYNTFYGKQRIQVNATADVGQSQTWVGNVGVGMSTNCGAIRGTYAYNVWTGQKCGTTDKQVASLGLNADGTPQSGSPVINAGNPSSYPSTDYGLGGRPVGGAPDAGAFEYGATPGGGTPTDPTPPGDTTAPQTTITTAPVSGTATTASIAFTSDEAGSTFACRLDGGAWTACVSPKGFSGLSVGTHSFDVRATDGAGNVDASPATATWTVSAPAPTDTTAPQTTITAAPTTGTATSASLSFASNEAGSTFACRIDGGAWGACSSPKTYTGLAVGTHTVEVRATDAAGNVDASPASATWTVDAEPTPPTTPTDPTPTDPTPPTTPTTPTAGLVGAWSFNESSGTTVKDATGHGLNGTRSGAASTTSGKFGRALSFDGDKDMVTVADNTLLHLTKGMTLEAWVYPTTQTGWRTVLAKEQSDNLVYGLYAASESLKPAADVFTTSEFPVKGTSALPASTWSHLAATFDGTTVRLFVNGAQVSSKAVAGSLKSSTGALRIGGTSVWGEWFKGKLDEIRVYNKALSSTQIKADMKAAI